MRSSDCRDAAINLFRKDSSERIALKIFMKISPPLSPYGSPLAENRQKEKTMTCKMVIVPLIAGLLVGSADFLLGSPDKTTYTYIYIDDTNCILNPPPNGTQCGSIHQARLDT